MKRDGRSPLRLFNNREIQDLLGASKNDLIEIMKISLSGSPKTPNVRRAKQKSVGSALKNFLSPTYLTKNATLNMAERSKQIQD